jgi:hypothetical protein
MTENCGFGAGWSRFDVCSWKGDAGGRGGIAFGMVLSKRYTLASSVYISGGVTHVSLSSYLEITIHRTLPAYPSYSS